VLRWFVEHHTWWSRPGPRHVARQLCLRSMRGVRHLAWLTGPFRTNEDFVRAGRGFIRCWLLLTDSRRRAAPVRLGHRRATARLLRMTFARGLDDGPVVVLNAFSLGAWATGLSVTMALASSCRIKSTGPDRDKVIHTMRELGPDHRYVVLGYPPFLKDLADDPRIDLTAYDVTAGFGGEGFSEDIRTYLLRSYRHVKGSYGASDLEANLAAETDFTIALRRELMNDAGLRMALLEHSDAALPMIFQYNPLDHVIETNAAGELVVTVCRAANLSPRIRYNIHDVGHVVRMPPLTCLLRRNGAAHLLGPRTLDLPVLFHYGRSDASVDFYGAVVTPDELRDALYAEPALADRMREFRLISWEDETATRHLLYAVELQPAHDRAALDVTDLATRLTVRVRRATAISPTPAGWRQTTTNRCSGCSRQTPGRRRRRWAQVPLRQPLRRRDGPRPRTEGATRP
jgi:phenylacetate-CoA ligase